ncbi:hypothetical protein [Streptomyces sp. NPDC059783]|uniref:hypothetical protein n=1 Tax=Streptomyces sp. NPDC059783 TaxID=3346944 RepID=UPI003652E8FB
MSRNKKRHIWILISALVVAAATAVAARRGWLDADRAGVLTAFLSLVAAVAAWVTSARASDTAEQASEIAEVVARIERDRWHHEITPQLDITIHEGGPGTGKAHMHVAFNGPAIHQQICSVSLTIIDDGRERRPGVTHGLTQDEIDAQIWGSYQFETTNDGASADGRHVPEFALGLGQQRSFWLIQTAAPGDYPSGNWSVEYGDMPVRVRVELRVASETRSWIYIREVQPGM